MHENYVGFIGLGAMGEPMARNLIKAGVPLVVCDLDPIKCQIFETLGARIVQTPAEVARHAKTIICLVETTAQTRSVITGPSGIMDIASAGHYVSCMSTIAPKEVQRLAEELESRGVGFVDAPISGGTEGASAGTLTIFAAGSQKSLSVFEHVFSIVGSNVFELGDAGQGTAAKLINNMLFQVNTVAVAEALTLAAAAGIAPQMLYDMVKVSTGYSVAFEMRAPRMIARNFEPGGKIDISYKDQELQTSMAKELGVPILLAPITQQIYQMGSNLGHGREDGSAVIKVYEAMGKHD